MNKSTFYLNHLFTIFALFLLAPSTSVQSLVNPIHKVCPINIVGNNPFNGLYFGDSYRLDNLTSEDLHNDYVIFANVPIEYAEFVLFGEIHKDDHHLYLQKKYIKILSQKSDLLLLEGHEALQAIECKDKGHAILADNLICLGWDDTQALSLFTNLSEKYNDIFAKHIVTSKKQFIKSMKRLQALKEFNYRDEENPREYRFNLLNETEELRLSQIIQEDIHKYSLADLYSVYRKLFGYRLAIIFYFLDLPESIYRAYRNIFGKNNVNSFLNGIKEIPIDFIDSKTVQRNRALIQTMKLLKCNGMSINNRQGCHRKLIIAGARHMFDMSLTTREEMKKNKLQLNHSQELIFSKLGYWDQYSDWTELREFIEQEKYVILYPSQG